MVKVFIRFWMAGTLQSFFQDRLLWFVRRGRRIELGLELFLRGLLYRRGGFHRTNWRRWRWRRRSSNWRLWCRGWFVWLQAFLSAWTYHHRPTCGSRPRRDPLSSTLQRERS